MPNPFNTGDEWLVDAKRVIIEDAWTRSCWEEWMGVWLSSYVFRDRFYKVMTYKDALGVLRDMEKVGREGWLEEGIVGDFRAWVRLCRRILYRRRHAGKPLVDLKPNPPSRELKRELFHSE